MFERSARVSLQNLRSGAKSCVSMCMDNEEAEDARARVGGNMHEIARGG